MNDLKIHFADSLVLFRHLVKEKREALKAADGSFTDINQAALYRQLFKAEFEGHDALEDVKALKKILFHSPTGTTSAEIINKSNTTTLSSAIADMSYLDKSHNLLKSFDGVIGDKFHPGILKRSLAKKLADSGLGYKDLQQLWRAHGEQGLLAILANPASSSSARRSRGTSDVVALNQILNHFKGHLPTD